MPAQIVIKIDPPLEKIIEKFGEKAREGFSQGLKISAFELRKAVQQLIRTSPRGGKSYRVGKNRFHRASAPGQPPARDTGNLMNNIVARLEDPLRALVEALPGYAGFLEDGTSKMKPRPFLGPATEKSTDAIGRIIAEEIEKSIR